MRREMEYGYRAEAEQDHNETNQETKTLNLESAYKKASAFLSNNRINRTDLNNPAYAKEYDSKRLDEIYNKEISNYNKQYEKQDNSKKLSVVQEALINDGVNNHKLFGGDFDAMKISQFDDERNHLDLMLLHHKLGPNDAPELDAYCGVDLTYSEREYINKIKDLIYRMDDNPASFFSTEIFIDEKTETAGSRLTPFLIISNKREDLEGVIPEWEHGNQLKENSSIDLDMLVQAWLQTSYFEQLPDDETEVGEQLVALYNANARIFENLVIQKSRQANLSPYVEDALERLSKATQTPVNLIRKFIVKRDDFTKPVLHKLIWGY